MPSDVQLSERAT